MKKMNCKNSIGFTIVELLIGIVFIGIIAGSILGALIVVQRSFEDIVAIQKSQATARIIVEKVVRPIRHGESFTVSGGSNTLTLTKYDSTVDTFAFDNGDGDDSTFADNSLSKNDVVIAYNVTKLQGKNIFEELVEDEVIEINLGVKNEGLSGHYKEIRISTQTKLRN